MPFNNVKNINRNEYSEHISARVLLSLHGRCVWQVISSSDSICTLDHTATRRSQP